MTLRRLLAVAVVWLSMATTTTGAWAQGRSNCAGLPSYTDLKNALIKAVTDETSGFDLNMWGTCCGS